MHPGHTAEKKTPDQARAHSHSNPGSATNRLEILLALVCGLTMATGLFAETAVADGSWIPVVFYVIAILAGGFFAIQHALHELHHGKFDIDFLMIVAAVGAASLGHWFEGALLLFLFSLGHALEHYAMGRARRAIEALAELAPETARVRRGEQVEEIPVEQLQRGDVVVIRPNDRIPADGFVIRGESSVDQSPITGESVPVDKRPVNNPGRATAHPENVNASSQIFAGTINQAGSLDVQVTRLASETTLARVVQMVNEAEAQKSPTQRFAERFERVFVPTVLAFVLMLLFAWVVINEPFSKSFYRAMAVLVAASPCALAISTPSAVLSGVARAARGGVLIKGGGPLENLSRVRAIAMDKTGTLTEGKPRVTDVVPASGTDERILLETAASIEQMSDHPLAAAVVNAARERLGVVRFDEATDLQNVAGQGIRGSVNGALVEVGKQELFSHGMTGEIGQIVTRLQSAGRTTMIVRRDDKFLGVIGLMDTPRESARRMIAKMHEMGIARLIMISGDNQQVADAVARDVGIDQAMGNLMPDDKVEAIRNLREAGEVAMIGDGVNDAPALAHATVGIAMGAAGSDVALETADVALMSDDLSLIPFVFGLSRQTSRIIRQNIWISLGMVAVLVPSTLFGLGMGAAVFLHEGSTIVVVLNALRLLGWRVKE